MESKIKSNHMIISFADSCLMLHTLIIVIKNFNLNYSENFMLGQFTTVENGTSELRIAN